MFGWMEVCFSFSGETSIRWKKIISTETNFTSGRSNLSVHRGRFSVRNHRTDPWFVLGLAPQLAKLQNASLEFSILALASVALVWEICDMVVSITLPKKIKKQQFQLHLWRYEARRRIQSWQGNFANDFWIWIVRPIVKYLQDLGIVWQALPWGLHSLCLCHVRHVVFAINLTQWDKADRIGPDHQGFGRPSSQWMS